MIKKKLYLPFIAVSCSLVFFSAGCTPFEVPYLILRTNGPYSYNAQDSVDNPDYHNVWIDYYFQAEREEHTCRITVEKIAIPENEEMFNEERRLYKEGEVWYNLADGSYRLRFVVLSQRGGMYYELPFLEETAEFTVYSSPGGGG